MTSDELARFDNQILEARAAEKKAVQEVERLRVELRSRDERILELQQFHDEATRRAIEYDMKARVADERIRELGQRLIDLRTNGEVPENWKPLGVAYKRIEALEQQLQTAQERLAEAEKAMTDAKIMLMSSWNAVHLGTLEDRALGFLKEYFAKHSAEKTESG